MGRYSVRILHSAAKEIEAISTKRERQTVLRGVESLAEDPWGVPCEKLAGREDRRRVRQGRFRIVFRIEDDVLAVVVSRIGHRKGAKEVRSSGG